MLINLGDDARDNYEFTLDVSRPIHECFFNQFDQKHIRKKAKNGMDLRLYWME